MSVRQKIASNVKKLGSTTVEYIALAFLLGMTLVSGAILFGNNIVLGLENIAARFGGATTEPGDGGGTTDPGSSTNEEGYYPGDIQSDITMGGTTDNFRPTIGGTTTPNSVVSIYANGVKIGETISDASGNWSYTPEADLGAGPNQFTTMVVDSEGTNSSASNPYDINIEAAVVAPPPISDVVSMSEETGEIKGSFPSNSYTDSTQPTFSGQNVQNNDIVSIYVDGVKVGETRGQMDGTWQYTPDMPLNEGMHLIQTVVTNDKGVSSEMSAPFMMTVDTTPPNFTSWGVSAGSIGSMMNGQTISATEEVSINGWAAELGASLTIIDNGVVVGQYSDLGNGYFNYNLPGLTSGEHNITSFLMDQAGNVSAPQYFNFTVE